MSNLLKGLETNYISFQKNSYSSNDNFDFKDLIQFSNTNRKNNININFNPRVCG